MGMGGYGSFMPAQPAVMPSRGKGNYYPGMGYSPDARNSTGPDWSQPPGSNTTTEPVMSIDEFSRSGLMGPTTMEWRDPVEFEGGMYDPELVKRYQEYSNPAESTPSARGYFGTDRRAMRRSPTMMQSMPYYGGFGGFGGGFGGGYGQPLFYGQLPLYGGLGGFLNSGYGFGGGPMYGGFRRRFDPYQTMMPQQQEYTSPSQEEMEPLLEAFTNFYLNDFQGRPQPSTTRSSTMRAMSPYGLGSLLTGG